MMQLPLKPYYTISASLLSNPDDKNIAIDEGTDLNILLSHEHSITPGLFSRLASLKNNFIISLSSKLIGKDILQEILPSLYLLVSLNLIKERNRRIYIPIFLHQEMEPPAIDTDIIANYFQDQGLDNISLPSFSYFGSNEIIQEDENCFFLFYSPRLIENMNIFLKDHSKEDPFTSLFIIGSQEAMHDLSLFNKLVDQINEVQKNGLLLFDFDDISGYYIEKGTLDSEKELWKKRAGLYQTFLTLSKTVQEREYYEVLDWYHKEYEILPLWYKRLGHIIKVIMGNRSFRSLYNDNVKKYKD